MTVFTNFDIYGCNYQPLISRNMALGFSDGGLQEPNHRHTHIHVMSMYPVNDIP